MGLFTAQGAPGDNIQSSGVRMESEKLLKHRDGEGRRAWRRARRGSSELSEGLALLALVSSRDDRSSSALRRLSFFNNITFLLLQYFRKDSPDY